MGMPAADSSVEDPEPQKEREKAVKYLKACQTAALVNVTPFFHAPDSDPHDALVAKAISCWARFCDVCCTFGISIYRTSSLSRGGGAAIPTGDPVAKQSSKADVVAFCVWKSETPLRWLEVTKSLDVAGMVAWHCT